MNAISTTHVPTTTSRILARAIDDVCVAVLLAPAFGWAGLFPLSSGPVWISWYFLVYLVVAVLAYEALAVWIFGMTAGKWVLGLRVVPVGASDRPMSGLSSLLRALAGRLSLFFSAAVQALSLLRTDRRHLADWVAGTRVVSIHPRSGAVRRHLIMGLLIVGVLGVVGWASAALVLGAVEIGKDGVFLNLPRSPLQPQ